MAIMSNNVQYGEGEYKAALDKYNKFKKGDQKINQVYKPISKTLQTVLPMFGPIGAAIGAGFSIADPIADAIRNSQGKKITNDLIRAQSHQKKQQAPQLSNVSDSLGSDLVNVAGATYGAYNTIKGIAANAKSGNNVDNPGTAASPISSSSPISITPTSGNYDFSTGSGTSKFEAPKFKYGGGIEGKGIFAQADKSGMTHGIGGPKEDANHAKLDGGFVVPANMVDKFFSSGVAEKLGLSKNKPADQQQAGGSHVKISPGEYYIDEKKLQLAKSMGVDLQEFAPNAKEPLQDGAKQSGGSWLKSKTLIPSTKAPQADLSKLYVKNPNFEKSDRVANPEREAGIMNAVFAGASGLADVGILAHNLSRQYRPMPMEHVARPDLLPTTLDTRAEQEQAKVAANTAYSNARQTGVDQTAATAGIYAQTLANNQKISEIAQNFQTQQEEKNTGILNSYRQNVLSTAYKNSMTNRQAADNFEQAKAESVRQSVTDLKKIGGDYLSNKIYLDSSKAGSRILANAVKGEQYTLASKYEVPAEYLQQGGSGLFELIQKHGSAAEVARIYGWKAKTK